MVKMDAATTQACEDRDFVEWHRGCTWCAVWVIRLERADVLAQVNQSRAALQPWLLPRYDRQPHVTVAYRGLMDERAAHPHATFRVQQLHEDIHRLQAAQLEPFVLALQGVGSFTTVPYLSVVDSLQLQQARNALAPYADHSDGCYVPHVTLGHYASQMPMATMVQHLQTTCCTEAVLTLDVSALWLARYRSSDIAGALHFEGCFDLRTQTYHAQPDALMVL